MADEIRATPRNSLAALLSDAINNSVGYMKDPRRTQQLQGLGRLIESTGIPATVENLSYDPSGRGLFMGAGGLGGTTRMRPEALEAAMTVAPFVGPANRGLMQATKGLPVGLGIQDVSKLATQSIVREGNPIQSAVVLIGDRIFTGRTHSEAFNRAIYEGAVRKEGGKFIYPKNAEVNSDLFMTKDGQIIDRLQASKMFDIGASETAIKEGLMQNKPASSISVDSYVDQATALKKQRENPQFQYPQQAALETAQRNAALPKSQGGLGLGLDNTAMQRADAMFPYDVYHGTNADIQAMSVAGKGKTAGAGAFVNDNPLVAETYVNSSGGGNIMPLRMTKEGLLDVNARGENWADITTNTLAAKAGKKKYSLDEMELDKNSATSTDELAMIAEQLGLKGVNIKNVKDLGVNSHIFRAKEYLQDKYGIVPDETWSNVTGKQFDEARKYMDKLYNSQRSTVTAVQDADMLRSRFAAFDPFRRTAAIAAAMGVAAPDLLANQMPVNPMYRDPFPDTTR